jgi:hypothetical protein
MPGRARLTADGLDGSIDLQAGDVAILNDRQWEGLEGVSGDGPRAEFVVDESDPYQQIGGADWVDADVIIGGNVDVNAAGEALLGAAGDRTRTSLGGRGATPGRDPQPLAR